MAHPQAALPHVGVSRAPHLSFSSRARDVSPEDLGHAHEAGDTGMDTPLEASTRSGAGASEPSIVRQPGRYCAGEGTSPSRALQADDGHSQLGGDW